MPPLDRASARSGVWQASDVHSSAPRWHHRKSSAKREAIQGVTSSDNDRPRLKFHDLDLDVTHFILGSQWIRPRGINGAYDRLPRSTVRQSDRDRRPNLRSFAERNPDALV